MNMDLKNEKMLLWAAALGILSLLWCATARAQVSEAWYHQGTSARSAAGSCSAADGFVCDAVTVAFLDGGSVLLQFTEHASHYTSLTGSADSENPRLISVDQVYLDGQLEANQRPGQCELIFVSGELSQIICPALTFAANGESQ